MAVLVVLAVVPVVVEVEVELLGILLLVPAGVELVAGAVVVVVVPVVVAAPPQVVVQVQVRAVPTQPVLEELADLVLLVVLRMEALWRQVLYSCSSCTSSSSNSNSWTQLVTMVARVMVPVGTALAWKRQE